MFYTLRVNETLNRFHSPAFCVDRDPDLSSKKIIGSGSAIQTITDGAAGAKDKIRLILVGIIPR